MSKRVLVTGSAGFTGRYMCAELEAAGYEVFGMGSQASDSPNHYQVDLQDAAQLTHAVTDIRPNKVIHLAALAFVAHGDANAFYKVNLIGTRNLLEALCSSSKTPDCVLLASSANIYGNQAQGLIDENTPPAPANDYGVSKLAMEQMAKTWSERLPLVIARPFNYTGVGQAENFLIPKIVAHYRRKAALIELGNLDVWRDFSDVRAVVAAYRGLIERTPLGQTFNVASGITYSLREVLALCEEITGHHMDVQVNPAFVRANEVRTLCGDATRLRSCLGDWQMPALYETLVWMLSA